MTVRSCLVPSVLRVGGVLERVDHLEVVRGDVALGGGRVDVTGVEGAEGVGPDAAADGEAAVASLGCGAQPAGDGVRGAPAPRTTTPTSSRPPARAAARIALQPATSLTPSTFQTDASTPAAWISAMASVTKRGRTTFSNSPSSWAARSPSLNGVSSSSRNSTPALAHASLNSRRRSSWSSPGVAVVVDAVAHEQLGEPGPLAGSASELVDPRRPVRVLEVEYRLAAALERHCDDETGPPRRLDGRRAVVVVEQHAGTVQARAFGDRRVERVDDRHLRRGKAGVGGCIDGPVDPEQALERAAVVDGEEVQVRNQSAVHEPRATAALSTEASSCTRARRAAAIAAGSSCWKMLRPNTMPAAPQSSR